METFPKSWRSDPGVGEGLEGIQGGGRKARSSSKGDGETGGDTVWGSACEANLVWGWRVRVTEFE